MNALTRPGRIHTHDPATVADLTARATIRQQEADCAALAAALETAIATVGKLSFPLGAPAKGYYPDDIIGTLRDMMPTQTRAEMVAATEVDPDVARLNTVGFWNDFLKEKRS